MKNTHTAVRAVVRNDKIHKILEYNTAEQTVCCTIIKTTVRWERMPNYTNFERKCTTTSNPHHQQAAAAAAAAASSRPARTSKYDVLK